MDLYIVRHAIAYLRDPEKWPDDRLRPLTPRGVRRFRRAAAGIHRLVGGVDVVLSSSYTRAWDTAAILADEAGWPAPTACPALEADGSPEAVLAALTAHGDTRAVALVGHEPYLHELVSFLLTGDPARMATELRKGALIGLTLPQGPEPGTASLRLLLQPRGLRALAKR
jgi:phosphohistidine phosphatase